LNDRDLQSQLRDIVYALALPSGRVVGTEGHAAAKADLMGRLDVPGCHPYQGDGYALPYGPEGGPHCNVVGVVPGADRSLSPVLIGAHYDCVIAAPCADDNAAALAITLMLGALFRDMPPSRDIVLALFDAEEPPYFQSAFMGSIRFHEDQMKPEGVHAALIMDLVGHAVELPLGMMPALNLVGGGGGGQGALQDLGNLLFVTGGESHPGWEGLIEQVGRPQHLPVVFSRNERAGDMSDHGIFRRNRVPYLFLSCGRWQHYHRTTDTPDRLDYEKMTRITRYAEALVRAVAQTEALPKSDRDFDTTALEIRHIKASFGPLLPLLLQGLGMKDLQTRSDLDLFAGRLTQRGL
jgi:hypothetical protein